MLSQLHHLYHVEVVETDGEGQSAQEDSTKEEAVLVCGVVGGYVVEVEYPDTKDSEVSTDAEVGHDAYGQSLGDNTVKVM